jgi:hypothetical protein
MDTRSIRASLLLVGLFVALLVGACLPSTASPSTTSSGSPPASASSSDTQAVPSSDASVEPASQEPQASDVPVDSGGAPSAEPGASASAGAGPAAACSGTDKNREFFTAAAAAVKWTVDCAVLPSGWFVESGQYRGSGGGWVQIAYKGPGGARLELHEGAFCTTADGCVPAGTDSGNAAFDAATGTLVKLDSGGWAIVVDRGKAVSWLIVGTGLDQATFQRLAAALVVVGA